MSLHNKGMRCTERPDCNCAKHCLCRACIFDRRTRTMYDGMRGRLAAKKWKSGARVGTVRKEKIDIPYTLDQFRAWVRVVLEDTPHCEYCLNPIDINTISPDHAKPMSRGGSLALANLRGACRDCNQLKGELLPGEFMALMKGLSTFSEHGRKDVLKRLRGSIVHFGSKRNADKSELKSTMILAIPAPKTGQLF